MKGATANIIRSMQRLESHALSPRGIAAPRQSRIQGEGSMAEAIRRHSWETTALGPLESWPTELIVATNMMLASSVPTSIMWGEEMLMLYNDAYIPIVQSKHPWALGRPTQDVWAEVYDQLVEAFVRAFETGEAFSFPPSPFHSSSDRKLTRRFYSHTAVPIWVETSDGSGIHGIYNTAIDESEKERVTAQLHQILESTTDAIFNLDRSWNFTYLNGNAKRLLASYGDLIGRNLWESFPAAVYEGSPFVRVYHRSMDQDLPGEFETFYPEPEGWFQVVSRPSPDGINVFFRDITASKQAAVALIQTEKLAAVGRLASSIAHEMNNPLESVTNLLYLARHEENVQQIRAYLDTADRELSRVSAITSQTLRFHKQASAAREVMCTDLFQTVLTIYQGRLANSRIEVLKRKRAGRPIECFDGEIRQVLNTLVGNAIDAIPPSGGKLYVRSREEFNWRTGERGVALTVADTGTGMAPQVLARIFDAFYTTKGIAGTGLGLWISKEIVDRHHGTLLVRSSEGPKHRGTVFIIQLPFNAVQR